MSNVQNQNEVESNQDHIFSMQFYLKMFGLLLAFFFVNLMIYKSSLPAPFSTILLISVAVVQAAIVALFFMELIHEDKFYLFTFVSCILFMLLFIIISLVEITGRSFFHPDEGAHILRGYDQQGVYAPAHPLQQQSTKTAPSS